MSQATTRLPAQPAPAPLWRSAAVAWTIARRFTRNLFASVLAYPVVFLSMTSFAWRGCMYESDDLNGVVLFGKRRPGLDLLINFVVLLMGISVLYAVVTLIGLAIQPTLSTQVVVLVAGLVTVILLGTGAALLGPSSLSPVGPETPKGERWVISSLAQRPGTERSAVILTRRLMRSLPSGAVLVASARTDELRDRYLRLRFTQGERRRVYYVAP